MDESQGPEGNSTITTRNAEVMRVIARNLHKLRRDNRFTLKEVATATGISITHVNRIENGISSAHLTTLQKLADVYGVPMAALFEGSGL